MILRALVKPALVAGLALLLYVPVGMIQGLVFERQQRSAVAVAGIAEGWGRHQLLAAPYLVVPYERTRTEIVQDYFEGKPFERRIERTDHQVLRLPADAVDWRVGAEVSEKARGIYKARLFTAGAEASGRFSVPARFGLAEDPKVRIKWGTPRLVLGVGDPQGIRSVSPLVLDGEKHAFEAGSSDSAATQGGVHVKLPALGAAKAQTLEFSFSIELAGSEALAIAPLGSNTAVTMRSDWPHPSFAGRFLPLRHDITSAGFTAEWKVSQYASPGVTPANQLLVTFVEPAGLYQRLERASKYGFLFIGLTFAAFLLVELLRRLAIHPIQYLLVGLALAMFFLLLTALSEHIDFTAAYAIATFACVGLISGYLVRVLRSARLGIAFGAALASLYGMLYALLKAEDYSLLGGSLLLFGLLAVAMIATRRVDWYELAKNRSVSGAQGA
jgi:inner membrane protein